MAPCRARGAARRASLDQGPRWVEGMSPDLVTRTFFWPIRSSRSRVHSSFLGCSAARGVRWGGGLARAGSTRLPQYGDGRAPPCTRLCEHACTKEGQRTRLTGRLASRAPGRRRPSATLPWGPPHFGCGETGGSLRSQAAGCADGGREANAACLLKRALALAMRRSHPSLPCLPLCPRCLRPSARLFLPCATATGPAPVLPFAEDVEPLLL